MSDMTLDHITKHCVAVSNWELGSCAGALALNNFSIIIDATMKPASAKMFRQKVEGHFGLPTKFFVLTHSHEDHSLVLGEFKDCTTIASQPAAQKIIEWKNSDWLEKWKDEKPEDAAWLDEVELLAPEISFQDKLVICDDELAIELHHVGGHSDCSLYVYAAHEKVIFAGDLLFARTFPYAGDPSCNPERWIEILEDWLRLDFENVIPGHGPVVGRDGVEEQLAFLKALRQATQEAIAAGKGVNDIQVPETYDLPEEFLWVKTGTLERFHSFYTRA